MDWKNWGTFSFVCLVGLGLTSSVAAQELRVREHPRVMPTTSDDVERGASEASATPSERTSPEGTPDLPWALQQGTVDRFPPVDGPVRLREDPRGAIPPQPDSLRDVQQRFFPVWRVARPAEAHTLTTDATRMNFEFQPEPGVCYVAIAWNQALGDFAERQLAAGGTLRWWESGADIDAQVRTFASDVLIAEDLTREAYPRVRWCSDGTRVRVLVRIARPDEAPDTVNFEWMIAEDPTTVYPQRFAGETPLARRLQWAKSVVIPRGRAISAPAIVRFARPGIVNVQQERPAEGCDVLVAVGEPTVTSLQMAVTGDRRVAGDFRGSDLAAFPLCADEESAPVVRIALAVRDGYGAVALARYRLR